VEKSGELLRLVRDHDWSLDRVAQLVNGVWIVEGVQPESTFDDEVHVGVAAIEAKSVWFRVRNTLILDLVRAAGFPPTIWEVGAGTGVVARELTRAGCEVVAVEPSIGGAAEAAVAVGTSIASTLESLCLPARSIPAIGLFDVIEHLDEPCRLLAECRRVLQPGGRLFLTVAAMQLLWSYSDEALGHHRRYSRTALVGELEDSGFVVWECSYRLWSIVLPVVLVRSIPYRLGLGGGRARIERQLGVSSRILTSFLIRTERMARGHSPFGTSLFAVASAP